MSRIRVYEHDIVVAPEVLDENNHVNNVVYIQWMQDVAVLHATAVGGMQATQAMNATWVARSHKIEYRRPVFLGEHLRLRTWVASFSQVRSLRKYQFVRLEDQVVVAKAETDWVFVDVATGFPKAIAASVSDCFDIVPPGEEPRG